MQTNVGVDVLVRLMDRATSPMRGVEDRVSGAARRLSDKLKLNVSLNTAQLDAAARRLTAVGNSAQQFGRDQLHLTRDQLEVSRQRTMSLYGEAAAVAAQGWAYGQMLRPAIEFEAKMAEVAKVVDFEGANGISSLANDIQALVTSGALPMAADGIADIIAAAAQAGVVDAALPDAEKRRQLIEFAAAAGKMAIAFDISADQAGQAMAEWQARMGLTQAEALKLGDAVNHLSNKVNASAADVTDIIGRVGGFAKVAGLSTVEIAALATAFRTAAPSPEIAATAMKNFTGTLVAGEAMTKQQSAVMKRLGFDATDLAKRMRVDARGAIFDVMAALQQLPEHEQAANLSLLFGQEAVAAIAPLLGNLDSLREIFGLVGDEAAYAGAMQAEYEGVAGTTAAKLINFRNYLTRLSVSLTPLLAVLTEVTAALQPMLQGMGDWMQANPEIVKWIGLTVAGLFTLKVGFLGVRMAVQSLRMAYFLFNGVLAGSIWVFGGALKAVAVMIRAFTALRMVLPLVTRALLVMGRAALLNPVTMAIAAIAAGAYLIWQNWEPIRAWFARLWGNVRDIFGGFGQFIAGVFSGDMSGAVAGLKQVWDGLSGYYQTLWDGITGVFLWAWDSIEPVLDGLFSAVGLGPVWEGVKTAIGAVLDWLKAAFSDAWAIISPVIDGLRWVKDKGAAVLSSVGIGGGGSVMDSVDPTAPPKGPSRPETATERAVRQHVMGSSAAEMIGGVTKRAQGGTFTPGLMLVGERGPELRYESRDGFIAHNNALRGLVDLSARAAALAGLVMGAGPGPAMADATSSPIAAPAAGNRQISYEPHYNIVINGSGLDAGQLRALVRAELQAAGRRAAADMRGLLHD